MWVRIFINTYLWLRLSAQSYVKATWNVISLMVSPLWNLPIHLLTADNQHVPHWCATCSLELWILVNSNWIADEGNLSNLIMWHCDGMLSWLHALHLDLLRFLQLFHQMGPDPVPNKQSDWSKIRCTVHRQTTFEDTRWSQLVQSDFVHAVLAQATDQRANQTSSSLDNSFLAICGRAAACSRRTVSPVLPKWIIRWATWVNWMIRCCWWFWSWWQDSVGNILLRKLSSRQICEAKESNWFHPTCYAFLTALQRYTTIAIILCSSGKLNSPPIY